MCLFCSHIISLTSIVSLICPFILIHSDDMPEVKTSKIKLSPSSGEVFPVEKILKERIGKGDKKEYLLKWLHYPESESTWEPESNLVRSEHAEGESATQASGSPMLVKDGNTVVTGKNPVAEKTPVSGNTSSITTGKESRVKVGDVELLPKTPPATREYFTSVGVTSTLLSSNFHY